MFVGADAPVINHTGDEREENEEVGKDCYVSYDTEYRFDKYWTYELKGCNE